MKSQATSFKVFNVNSLLSTVTTSRTNPDCIINVISPPPFSSIFTQTVCSLSKFTRKSQPPPSAPPIQLSVKLFQLKRRNSKRLRTERSEHVNTLENSKQLMALPDLTDHNYIIIKIN